jgi:hypothetical protein
VAGPNWRCMPVCWHSCRGSPVGPFDHPQRFDSTTPTFGAPVCFVLCQCHSFALKHLFGLAASRGTAHVFFRVEGMMLSSQYAAEQHSSNTVDRSFTEASRSIHSVRASLVMELPDIVPRGCMKFFKQRDRQPLHPLAESFLTTVKRMCLMHSFDIFQRNLKLLKQCYAILSRELNYTIRRTSNIPHYTNHIISWLILLRGSSAPCDTAYRESLDTPRSTKLHFLRPSPPARLTIKKPINLCCPHFGLHDSFLLTHWVRRSKIHSLRTFTASAKRCL